MRLTKGPGIVVAIAAASLGIASIAPVIATGPPYNATEFAKVLSPIGVAATPSQVLVTSGYFGGAFGAGGETIDSLSSTGGTYTQVGTVPAAPAGSPFGAIFGDNVEAYPAVSPGLGGFPAGNLYVTDGPYIWEYAPNSSGFSTPTLFATIPQIAYQQPIGNPELAVGITFDTVGTYGYDMILTSVDGSIYTVNSSGVSNELTSLVLSTDAPLGTYIEGPAVAPLSFVPYGGDLIVASESNSEVYAYNPASFSGEPAAIPRTEFVPIASVPSAENVQVVPESVCSFGTSEDAWFSATYGQGQVSALPTAALTPYEGDLIVNSEYPGQTAITGAPNATVLAPTTSFTGVTTTTLVNNLAQQEGQAVVQCPPPSGGFVTGGGNLDDVNGQNLTFGFVANMVNGLPSGHTTVVEHSTTGFNFKSSGYSSISVNGCIATYTGTGTYDGTGGYDFTVNAVDSRISGCPYPTDEFSIQITSSGSTVFYQPLTPLEQGSGIQIH